MGYNAVDAAIASYLSAEDFAAIPSEVICIFVIIPGAINYHVANSIEKIWSYEMDLQPKRGTIQRL
jgi:hypothetical protein